VKNLGQLITTEDIVLANKEFDLEKGKNKKAFEVGVNLICNEETEDHFEIILDNLISFLDLENVKDYFIKLIPFYTYSNNDIKYYEKVIQKEKYREVVSIEKEPSGIADLLEIFSSKTLVVSMRYHCSLISLILGIPTLTIEYDTHQHYPNKTLYLKNVLAANRIKFSTLDEENIIKGLQKALSSKMDLESRDEILKSGKKSLNKVLSYI
jgi:polysaccharide pyruvyl transferase WcaK-like protein